MQTDPLEHSWLSPPAIIDLPPGEIHLWSARLDPAEEFLRRCEEILAEEERQRAAKFRAGSLRTRYTAGRGTLRFLLGRYFQENPAKIELAYLPHGKPELGPAWKDRGVEFNLSHTGDLALLAFTRGRAVGVDVEAVRPMPNAGDLLKRFFAAQEIAQWQASPAERRDRVFFQGWTRKEAWLKAVGSGLSFPLDQFCVTMDGPARVLSIRGDVAEVAAWRLESCEPAPGYVAAVAVQGEIAAIRPWRFAE